MDSPSGQSADEIYAGLAQTERAIGRERSRLAHLATQRGLPKDQLARVDFRRNHVRTIKTLETDLGAMEAELRARGR
jgi:hypothetical protein